MARQNVEYTDTLRQGTDKWNANDIEEYAHIASTSNPHSVTKAQVGLSNVDNTSDITKALAVQETKTTDYTLVLADASKTIATNSATPIVITIPLEATVGFPEGTNIELTNIGSGAATVAITATGTLTSSAVSHFIIPPGNLALLRKLPGTNTWKLYNGSPGLGYTSLVPTQTGIDSALAYDIKYCINGKQMHMFGTMSGTKSAGTSVLTITNVPGTIVTTVSKPNTIINNSVYEVGKFKNTSGTTLTFYRTATETGFTNGFTLIFFDFLCEIS